MSLQNLKRTSSKFLWRLLASTLTVNRYDVLGGGSSTPVIFACLHRDIIPAIVYVQPVRPYLLVSESSDGDILIHTIGRGSYRYVRGSSESQGRRAFVELLKALQNGCCVGLAVDGPRGPYGVVQDGVLQLSRRSGKPIVPLTAYLGNAWFLNTWDKTAIPKPFSAVAIAEKQQIIVPADCSETGIEEYRDLLTSLLLEPQHEDT